MSNQNSIENLLYFDYNNIDPKEYYRQKNEMNNKNINNK